MSEANRSFSLFSADGYTPFVLVDTARFMNEADLLLMSVVVLNHLWRQPSSNLV